MRKADKSQKNNDTLVKMENVSIRFGQVLALNDVNFHVNKKEIVGLLGDNGAGKSSLIKTLIGYHELESGKIYWKGKVVKSNSPDQSRLNGIEVQFQELALIDRMNIYQNFFLGRELYKNRGGFRILDTKLMETITEQQLKLV
ncbi:MAG: ATP-binding cassette domain-containing protein, partial [Spirochaetales bacterium]|nr:ATP-binding cassette domain-containing protein [Spirochaetales bacterium]